jgi:YVTN family beta-propeller protein
MRQSRSRRAWPVLLALALSAVETAWAQPAGPRVYVSNYFGASSNTVSVIDSGANRLIATIPVGAGPLGIAVSPSGSRAYVANELGDSVSVIDTATNTVVDTVTPVPGPKDVAVSPDGQLVYVTRTG